MRKILFVLTLFFSLPGFLLAEEVWVACGYGGRRMISLDAGKTWEITAEWIQPGKDDKYNLMGLVFAEGKFVCVGGGGGGNTGGGHILVSEDGRAWKQVVEAGSRINPVAHASGRFVVGGPKRQQLSWSDDGESWHDGGKIEGRRATHWRHAAFGNGTFVFTGNNGGNSPCWIITTKDGTTVDSFVDEDLPSIRDIAFGNGKFVIVGGDGVRRTSTDGIDWEKHDVEPDKTISWVVFDGDQFLCGTRPVTASRDGFAWEPRPESKVNGVKWTDGERFILSAWPGKMSYSPDGGETVEKANELTANGINKVVRGILGE